MPGILTPHQTPGGQRRLVSLLIVPDQDGKVILQGLDEVCGILVGFTEQRHDGPPLTPRDNEKMFGSF